MNPDALKWSPYALQERVRRFKASSGKESTLGCMAGVVESIPWYASRLTEYLQKAPIIVEQGYKVKSYSEALSNMSCDMVNLGRFLDMAKDIPKLALQLRVGSCNELMVSLKNAVLALWDGAKEKTVTFQQLGVLSKILHETANTYPWSLPLLWQLRSVVGG